MPEETHLNSYNSFNHAHRTVHNKSRNEYKLPTNSARKATPDTRRVLSPQNKQLPAFKASRNNTKMTNVLFGTLQVKSNEFIINYPGVLVSMYLLCANNRSV